jgi:hypothetical protein
MDGSRSCGVNERDDHIDSASEDSSDETLESSDDSTDDQRNARQHTQSRRKHDESRIIRCVLDDVLELSEDSPRSLLLLKAHQQLESLNSETHWTIVQKALRSFGPQSPQAEQGDEKIYKRRNVSKAAFPQDCWKKSIKRLLDRVDNALSGLKAKDVLQAYLSLLPGEQKRAFKACLQVWRKLLRGAFNEDEPMNEHWHRLLTSIEASVLCHNEYTKRLIICSTGKSIDLSRLRQELESTVRLSETKNDWLMLDVCGDSSAQMRSVLYVVLSLSDKFKDISLVRHGLGRTRGQFVIPRGPKQMALLAMLLQSRHTTIVRNCMDEDNDQDVFTEMDYRITVKKLQNTGDTKCLALQPRLLASLATMSSLIVRRHALNTSILPLHLQESVRTASTCISCRRIMTSGRLDPIPSPSTHFIESSVRISQAGFKAPRPIVHQVIASLSSGNPYLPPLTETYKLDAGYGQISEVNIGGPSNLQLGSSNAVSNEEADWHFCPRCAALHLKVVESTSEVFCDCFVCRDERESRPGHLSVRWRREVRSVRLLSDQNWTQE